MSELIKVSTEEMQATLNTFNTQKGAQMSAYESMKNIVAELGGSYLGEASQTFQNQFQSFYGNLSQSEAKMADAVDELAKSADLFVGAEIEKLKSKAAALETGRSPFN